MTDDTRLGTVAIPDEIKSMGAPKKPAPFSPPPQPDPQPGPPPEQPPKQ